MKGNICLVSGANSGIGFEMAKGLALKGAEVLLLCRNLQKAEVARQLMVDAGAKVRPRIFIADYARMVTVRKAAREIAEAYDHLDVLINNAGAIFMKRKLSPDGIESSFQVDYLSHFLLTELLLPLLKASEQARVINVVGEYHRKVQMNWEDLQFAKKYSPMRAGSQAQLCKILHANDLARRYVGDGIRANSFHPGAVRTNLQKGLGFPYTLLTPMVNLFFKSPAKGADTGIWLASSPDVAEVSGKYFIKRHQVEAGAGALSVEDAERLRRISLELSGLSQPV